MKTCCRCAQSKPPEAFRPRAAARDGLQYRCKDCANAERKAHRDAFPEIRRAAKTAYRLSNPDKVRAQRAAQRAKTRDRENEMARAYKKANRPIVQAAIALRNATKLRATPAWANASAILGYYETADALGMWTGEWYHVDHVVPLQSKRVCGLHCEANLQVIPGSDNQSKGNRHWPDMPTSH